MPAGPSAAAKPGHEGPAARSDSEDGGVKPPTQTTGEQPHPSGFSVAQDNYREYTMTGFASAMWFGPIIRQAVGVWTSQGSASFAGGSSGFSVQSSSAAVGSKAIAGAMATQTGMTMGDLAHSVFASREPLPRHRPVQTMSTRMGFDAPNQAHARTGADTGTPPTLYNEVPRPEGLDDLPDERLAVVKCKGECPDFSMADFLVGGVIIKGAVKGGVSAARAAWKWLTGKSKHAADDLFLRSSRAGPRLHGKIPHKGQLKKLQTEQLTELREMTQKSLKTREREIRQLGDKGQHGQRIGEERRLLESIETILRDRGVLK
jgi:hypothetical protein